MGFIKLYEINLLPENMAEKSQNTTLPWEGKYIKEEKQ